MSSPISRRDVLISASAASAAALSTHRASAQSDSSGSRFAYCLNTSTVRGQKLDLKQQVDLAIAAGYDAIEPWIRDISAYRDGGGSLADIANRCADGGLKVISAIGFAQWIVNDDAQRQKGFDEARRDMELVKAIGGTHIAAPPAGAHREGVIDLRAAGERYHALCELGREVGVIPQVEFWGPSTNLSKLSEAVFVAIESGHADACVMPDVYHMYKGGSEPAGLRQVGRMAIHNFHMNDYPADPPRATISDADRIYPGDGIGDLDGILQTLAANGVRCYLSLELFNRAYWEQDAMAVAKTGVAKMKAAVRRALG